MPDSCDRKPSWVRLIRPPGTAAFCDGIECTDRKQDEVAGGTLPRTRRLSVLYGFC